MSFLWLNDDELEFMTGYRQREKQYKALAELAVPFKQRPKDGFPLVERWRYEGMKPARNKEPNYG